MPSDSELDAIVSKMNVEITLHPESENKPRFTRFQDLKGFFEKERRFWDDLQQVDGSTTIRDQFNRVIANLDAAKGQIETEAARLIREALQNASDRKLIFSGTATAKFLRALSSENTTIATGALHYFGDRIRNQNDGPYFDGLVRACLFRNLNIKDESLRAEQQAFVELRGEMTGERDGFREEYANLRSETDSWKITKEQMISDLLEEKRKALDETNRECRTKLEGLHSETAMKMQALESSYREKLRFEGPVEHWTHLETKYLKAARLELLGAIVVVIVSCVVGGWLIYQPPVTWEGPQITPKTVKSAIVLTVLISLVLYLVNLLARLVTSSYHLARDARERRQLTHVFLALREDKMIGEKHRELVLSALFSRADTGLLRHDGTPALPSSFGALIDAIRGKP